MVADPGLSDRRVAQWLRDMKWP